MPQISDDVIRDIVIKELYDQFDISNEIFYMNIKIEKKSSSFYKIQENSFLKINRLKYTIDNIKKYIYNKILKKDYEIIIDYLIYLDPLEILNSLMGYFNIKFLDPYTISIVTSNVDLIGYLNHIEFDKTTNTIHIYFHNARRFNKKLPDALKVEKVKNIYQKTLEKFLGVRENANI